MKIKSKLFYWYVTLLVLFIALTLIPSPDTATLIKYHLTPLGVRLLDLTVIFPEAIIWFAAFYGYQKIQHYSQLIRTGKEGKQIAKLSRGLLLLAIGLPVIAIMSSILTIIASHHPSFTATSVIIQNYANIVFPLLAFIWISNGARGLSELTRTRPPFIVMHIIAVVALTLGIAFCCLIVSQHRELRLTYHMSPQLVMLTLGIPYIYIWSIGLQACAELLEYSRKVHGVLYRKAWIQFISGLAAIIFISILLQYLTTLYTWLNSLTLGAVLLLLYSLLLLLGGAYIVVALGAKRLTKLEEV